MRQLSFLQPWCHRKRKGSHFMIFPSEHFMHLLSISQHLSTVMDRVYGNPRHSRAPRLTRQSRCLFLAGGSVMTGSNTQSKAEKNDLLWQQGDADKSLLLRQVALSPSPRAAFVLCWPSALLRSIREPSENEATPVFSNTTAIACSTSFFLLPT